jgi:predicted enzyme related to lactoylglutathione lyase
MKLSYGIFYTNNLQEITQYYQDVVGFELASKDNKFVSFKIGDSFFGIKIRENEREIPGHQTVIVSVNDLDDWYKKLKGKGVAFFSDLVSESWGRNFSILDLDGNKVEFSD